MAETGALLRLWLGLSRGVAPLARWHLARRVRRGKESPDRVAEKMGHATLPRPNGPLVWMHAVGVGEVLALPALVAALRARSPGISVLITSSSRTSAEALAPNLPEGAVHQFLPLDAAPFIRRFLDHWRPDLSVWAERDIWPALVVECDRRGIPLAIVNGKMNAASRRSKQRAGRLYRDLYRRFAHIGVQDAETAGHFRALGVEEGRLRIAGSFKAGAAPLADQPEARARLETWRAGRRLWLAASTHPGDEAAVFEAQRRMPPGTCLIIAPRDPGRAGAVADAARSAGLEAAVMRPGNTPEGAAPVQVLGQIGQLGLWYRLADAAFIGGSLSGVGGHNPYEAARLDCAILHGPDVANFAADYAAFHDRQAARIVLDGAELAAALQDDGLAEMRPRAAELARAGAAGIEAEAEKLLSLLPGRLHPGG